MISFIDLSREYKSIKKEIDEAISKVLIGGHYVLNSEVENFEREFAKFCGTKYCVTVASGTDALFLSLRAIGVESGDEVITVTNSFVATALSISMLSAKPVFVDIDPETQNIDTSKIEEKITSKTKVIIPVHLYGRVADMGPIKEIAKKHGLKVLEDACQAHGAVYRGERVGGLGDVAAFSFYPSKNLGGYGDGGAITTNNEDYYKQLLALRFYGQYDRKISVLPGINSRLDEIQAAILRVKLKYLNSRNEFRQKIADMYRRLITNPNIIIPKAMDKDEHVYHLFVAQAKNRDNLRKVLEDNGVQTMIHYPVLLHNQPIFQEEVENIFPQAEKCNSQIFSLPMYPFLEKKEVEKIAEILNNTTT